MNKVIILYLFIVFTCFSGLSQDRYFVYFKDKASVDYPFSLGQPEDFLSLKSIERRGKQSIRLDRAQRSPTELRISDPAFSNLWGVHQAGFHR